MQVFYFYISMDNVKGVILGGAVGKFEFFCLTQFQEVNPVCVKLQM